MSLRLYHLPKTGGMSVRHALKGIGLEYLIRRDHRAARECVQTGETEAVFVRHPVAWWRSMHSYMRYRAMRGKEVPNVTRDSIWACTYGLQLWACRWHLPLEKFLDDAWQIDPHLYSTVVDWFTPRCVIGRTERLMDDLRMILKQAGIDEPLPDQEPLNVSPRSEVSDETASLILDCESRALAAWERLADGPQSPSTGQPPEQKPLAP